MKKSNYFSCTEFAISSLNMALVVESEVPFGMKLWRFGSLLDKKPMGAGTTSKPTF